MCAETWHVLPVNDLTEHAERGQDCTCSPRRETVPRADGSTALLVTHNSFDGRERFET